MNPRPKKKAPFAWISDLVQALGAIPKKDLLIAITVICSALGSLKSCGTSEEAKDDVAYMEDSNMSQDSSLVILERRVNLLSQDLLKHQASDARALRRLRMQRALEARSHALDETRPLPDASRKGPVRRFWTWLARPFRT